MKKNCLCLIVFFSVIIYSCNYEAKNDLKKWNLYGNVESIKENSFIAIEKFGEIVKGGRESFNSREQNYIFNHKGNKIKDLCNNIDGSLSFMSEYKYDEKGNNSEILNFGSEVDLTDKWEYKYDEKGNLIEMNNFDKSHNLYSKTKCENDEKGNLIKDVSYNSDGKLEYISEYKYDEKGNRIEWTNYNDKGIVLTKYELKNDEKGNAIEVNCFMSAVGISYKIESKYEYDEKNNWIKKIDIKDGIPEQVTERVIKYF